MIAFYSHNVVNKDSVKSTFQYNDFTKVFKREFFTWDLLKYLQQICTSFIFTLWMSSQVLPDTAWYWSYSSKICSNKRILQHSDASFHFFLSMGNFRISHFACVKVSMWLLCSWLVLVLCYVVKVEKQYLLYFLPISTLVILLEK